MDRAVSSSAPTRLQAILGAVVALLVIMVGIAIGFDLPDAEHATPGMLSWQIDAHVRALLERFEPGRYATLVRLLDVWNRRYEDGGGRRNRAQRDVTRGLALLAKAVGLFQARMRRALDALMVEFENVRAQPRPAPQSDAAVAALRRHRDDWMDEFGWFLPSVGADLRRRAQVALSTIDDFLAQTGPASATNSVVEQFGAGSVARRASIYWSGAVR